jgi:hypothetical protein
MTQVRVHTTDYQFAHGHMPRGTGTWAFFFNRNASVDQAFWFSGSFTDAKRAAVAAAKAREADDVFVGS